MSCPASVKRENLRSPTSCTVEAATTTPKNCQTFEITYPLAISSKKDRYLPSKITPSNRRRRVIVEVHKVLPQFEEQEEEKEAPTTSSSSTNKRRSILGTSLSSSSLLSPKNSSPKNSGKKNDNNQDTAPEICYIKILMNTAANPIETLFRRKIKKDKHRQHHHHHRSMKESSDRSWTDASFLDSIADNDGVASINSFTETSNDEFMETSNGVYGLGDWFTQYQIPLTRFDIIEKKKRTVIVTFLFRGLNLRREFIFDREEDATRFCQFIEKEKQLLGSRANARLEAALGDIELKKGEQLSLLFDIVSGTNLPTQNPDPYVVVRLNEHQIHKTESLSNTKNPIWTLRKESLFILQVDALELFQADDGLIFEVKSKSKSLGAFSVSPRTIYKWNGERKEFALKTLSGKRQYNQGKVALRVRRTTEHDLNFLENYKQSKKTTISNVPDDLLPTLETGGSALNKFMNVHKKTEATGPDKGKTKYLVRPGPDPKRKVETEWLTKEQIDEEALKPSHSWLDIGSGNLGKIFVEVISCDGLPNMDPSLGVGNVSDAFVSLVYEDCFARTHTVDDCLSPRFMPWSRRAFIFNMMHTSSQLFVGVFDEDPHTSHELIGRVTVDLTNFIPNMVYTMKYNLYPTAKCNQRENKYGTITIRLRMDLEDERTLLLSNFRYPESVYVNIETKKDFKVMHQTVHGKVDMKKFNIWNVTYYMEELYEYLTIYYYLEDSLKSLILWRSKTTIPVPILRLTSLSISWVDVSVPLHSLMAFLVMISIVENLDLMPSFFFGSIGWILIATMEYRTSWPDPWNRCKSFQHYFWALICGDGLIKPRDIAPNENIERIKLREEAWKKRVADAEHRALEYQKQKQEYWKKFEETADIDEDLEDLSIMKKGFSLNPTTAGYKYLYTYLYPAYQWLGTTVKVLRITKNIVIWEESYISFWIAVFSFLLSVLALFVPWSLIVKWTLRFVVYLFFGPWMKLVDKYYFQMKIDESEEKAKNEKYLAHKILQAQVVREFNTKLRDFKQYMFGNYITTVNIMKKDRFFDKPLPASSAIVYNSQAKSLGALAMQEAGHHLVRVDGQQLVGEMIPKIYETPPTEAPIGKPTKKTDGDIPNYGDDSYGMAVTKVGAILVGAAIVSVYFVPNLLGAFSDLINTDIQ
ncbi:hypothetical protein ACHAXM_011668 [Skeletonema potamos]